MVSILPARESLFKSIIEYGAKNPDIRALVLVGSSARIDHPADEWSDIDLILITPFPDRYLLSSDWLFSISEPWIITVERDGSGNIIEQRVLFRSGVDVDFIVVHVDHLEALQKEPMSGILRGGARVLLDKDGCSPLFESIDHSAAPFRSIHSDEFLELVNDFWFHAVWTAKKMKRGELWTAKSCCDIYMKRLLLTMIEWHVCSIHEGPVETWYRGRFVEKWAPAWIVERLSDLFALYNEDDLWRALPKTMQLFDEIARLTSHQLLAPYPEGEAKNIQEWILHLKDEQLTHTNTS